MTKRISTSILSVLLSVSVTAVSFAQTYQKTERGVKVRVNKVNIDVQFYTSNIVRILKSPVGTNFHKTSFAVIKKPEHVDFSVKRNNNTLDIVGKSLKVSLDLKDGKVSFYSSSGKELLTEKAGGTQFSPCKDPLEHAFDVRQSFQLTNDEAIYGLGQHQRGTMDQRNQTLFLEQRNRQIDIPYFYSTRGYGLFWDNTSTTIFKDTTGVTYFDSTVGKCVDYYVLREESAIQGLARWEGLTGKAPMFPKWAFGYWQSRERYKTQDQLLGVVEKYRSLKVPLDVIVQDWRYWGGVHKHWNSTKFISSRYPQPKEMVSQVHKMNAHIVISVWPSFGEDTQIYKEMNEHGYLYKEMNTWPPTSDDRVYDVFNPGARSLYWSFLNRDLFSIGIDGWWLDSTEPDQLGPAKRYNDITTHLGLFGKVRNAFPIEHVGGVFKHQRAETSKKRVVILARSAYAGQQRYGSAVWSGDTQSDWKSLHAQITNGLNMAISGIPYWTMDIGGFFSNGYPKGSKDPAFQELYVRWLELGAFCPIMRSHGTSTPREIYQFGHKGYWAYDAIDNFINLRYRLLPYIYSNAWRVTSQAYAIMRPLIMDFPNDEKVRDINNEYMFGPSFLVRPVTRPLYTQRIGKDSSTTDFSRVKTVTTYLPKGTEWYNFWTGKKITGGEEVTAKAPINRIPLYVKAGAVLPMGPFEQYSTQKPDAPIEIRVYPGKDGHFPLYEDENNNYDYQHGSYSLIPITWNDATRSLTIDKRKGGFNGMVKNRVFKIVIVNEQNGSGIAETPASETKTVKYSGKAVSIHFK
ncbi:MAG TPA: TIM-barrel domain-containing protein [Balneolales bacterium]|nr:TIM-barrel domain-containing protein [Balneolales bacterium]